MGGSSGTEFGRWGRQLHEESKEALAKELARMTKEEIKEIVALVKELKKTEKKP